MIPYSVYEQAIDDRDEEIQKLRQRVDDLRHQNEILVAHHIGIEIQAMNTENKLHNEALLKDLEILKLRYRISCMEGHEHDCSSCRNVYGVER
jgi:hypothetical protein